MKTAYTQQRSNCKARGIEFDFTFDEWAAWWKRQLGPDWHKMRGCRRGQYVMARYYDDGPYAAHNVKAMKCEDNIAEYNKRRKQPSKPLCPVLPDEVVRAIYLDGAKYRLICKKYAAYGVSTHRIQCIKQKIYYRAITDELD